MNEKIIYWNVDPVIFQITDTLPLQYYGMLFVGGIMLGYLIVKRVYKKEDVPIEQLDALLIYIFIGTLLGARLGHCLFYEPQYYLTHPLEILLPIKYMNGAYQFIGFKGLASHGGAIGVLLAILLYCKKYKANILWVLDKAALGFPIAAGFIRLGNLMNSEIYGKPTNGNWGVVFMRDDLIPRHPTQLYEALSYFAIFFILYYCYNIKKERQNGFVFGICLVLLFSARLIIEFFKENQVGFESNLLLNMGQLLSIPFIIFGAYLMLSKSKVASGIST